MSKECRQKLLSEGFLGVLSANSSFWKGEVFVVQRTAVETIRGDYQGSFVGCCIADHHLKLLKCAERKCCR